MNLQKSVTISPVAAGRSASRQIDELKQLPLFEAVRTWMDNEAVWFDIVDEGEPLTEEKIHEIVHSEAYKELLLAFDIRR